MVEQTTGAPHVAKTPPTAIAVFAKAPVEGSVKTRLIPLLGAAGATRLHEELLDTTLQLAAGLDDIAVQLWVAGAIDDPFIVEHAARHRATVHAQRGPHLGARMANAFDTMLSQYRAALIIGIDCPARTTADLDAARAALRSHDVVVQPAHDGGYVMIGLRRPLPALFDGITWGGAQVLAHTRAKIAALGYSAVALRTVADLDTPDDYRAACAAGWLKAKIR